MPLPACTALVIVDAQAAFAHLVGATGAAAVANIQHLYRAWTDRFGLERLHLPYVAWKNTEEVGHVERFMPGIGDLLREGRPEVELIPGLPRVASPEFKARSVRKCGFDATRDTVLVRRLRGEGVTNVTLCGLTTPVCVAETVAGLCHEGFAVTVVGDACASQEFPPHSAAEAHDQAIARLRHLWAGITSTAQVLESLS